MLELQSSFVFFLIKNIKHFTKEKKLKPGPKSLYLSIICLFLY